MVGFEISLFFSYNFKAIKFSLINDVQSVPYFSLNNNILVWLSLNFFHCINDYIQIIFVKAAKEDTFFN